MAFRSVDPNAGYSELYSVKQIAVRLGVSSKKVLELIHSGKLTSYCIGPKKYRISRQHLTEFLESVRTAAVVKPIAIEEEAASD